MRHPEEAGEGGPRRIGATHGVILRGSLCSHLRMTRYEIGTGDIRTVTVRIEGRVQGVYFRAWTDRRRARSGSTAGCATRATAASRRCSRDPPRQVEDAAALRRWPARCAGDRGDHRRRRRRVAVRLQGDRHELALRVRLAEDARRWREARRRPRPCRSRTPSAARLVTGVSTSPHGTMPEKCSSSGSTLRLTPCSVTQRRTRTPMLAILAPSHEDADLAGAPLALDAEPRQRRDQPVFEQGDEGPDVAAAPRRGRA